MFLSVLLIALKMVRNIFRVISVKLDTNITGEKQNYVKALKQNHSTITNLITQELKWI